MVQYFFKPCYRSIKIAMLAFVVLQSCHDNAAEKPAANAGTVDTIDYSGNLREDNGAFNKYKDPAEEEKAAKQKMLMTQIDSTYTAISLLDEAKTEMTSLSPAELSVAERNKKSKAIFNINILQNELTRALDASILSNLRVRTNELAGITAEMQKNVVHLQSVTEKLNKATMCIGRLTDLLALGLSQGIIKPLTPRTATAEAVKAAL